MHLGKHTNAIVLFLLALCVLFPFSGLDLYATDRSYKFLDAALVMGVFLLTVRRLALTSKHLVIISLATAVILLPIYPSSLDHDALIHAVPLLFLLLGWMFWSVIRMQNATSAILPWFAQFLLVILSGWSLWQLLPLLLDGSIDHQETYAVSAGLGHRNLLVQLLLILLPMLLVYRLKGKWSRKLELAMFVVVGTVILLLLNRTGWLGLGLMLGFIVYHKRRSGRMSATWKWLLIAVIPLGLLLLFVDELYTLWHHVEMTFTWDDGTTRDRILLMERSSQMFLNAPMLGIGYGMWPIEAMGFDQTNMLSESASLFYKRPHNDYLRLLSEGGLLLGLPYLLLHTWAIARSWRQYRSDKSDAHLGVFLMWSMIILASASNYPIEQPLFMVLQALALSMLFPLSRSFEGQLDEKRRSGIARILSVGLWITVVLIAFDHGGAKVLFEKARKAQTDRDPGFALAYLDAVRESADLDAELRPFQYWEAAWNEDLSLEERTRLLQDGLLLVPDHPHLHEALGRSYADAGDLQQAMQSFQHAVRYTPTYQAAWLGIAEIHQQQGDWREAFEAILRADAISITKRYRDLGTPLAQDSLTALAKNVVDRKMQLTLIAIRNTPDWSLDILRKTVNNRVNFDHQAYVDACYYMWMHCEKYEDCDLAETMINRYLPNGKDDLNLEETKK